jgi:hypothetical protein
MDLLTAALGISEWTSGEIKRQTMAPPNAPGSSPTLHSNPSRLHSIQKGDTLFGLAKLQYRDAEVFPDCGGESVPEKLPHHQLPVGTMILLP